MGAEQRHEHGLAGRPLRAIRAGATFVLAPPRTALVLGLGGSVLAARFVQRALGRAADEGKQQLDELNGLFERLASRIRSWNSTSQDTQS
jgi:hypothetical protein